MRLGLVRCFSAKTLFSWTTSDGLFFFSCKPFFLHLGGRLEAKKQNQPPVRQAFLSSSVHVALLLWKTILTQQFIFPNFWLFVEKLEKNKNDI